MFDDVIDPEILLRCLKTWGAEAQLRILQEECGELVAAVSHFCRNRASADKLAEELADVLLTAAQVSILVGPDRVRDQILTKQRRVVERLEGISPQGSREPDLVDVGTHTAVS